MTDRRSRLRQCFQAVFPNLSADSATRASLESVPEWDSLAAVTLVAVVEEEFGFAIDPDELPKLTSFDQILRYLEAQGQPA